jgi:hypothetical protein
MNLVGGDRRPPKQGQSYVCEGTLLRRAGSPVFPLHHAEVRRGAAERDSIPLVIRAHSAERATPGDPAFEVVNVRRLQIRPGRLIVAAISVKPRNRVRVSTAVRRPRPRVGLLTGNLLRH